MIVFLLYAMDYVALTIFLDDLLREYQGNVPGCSVGIIVDNRLIFTKCMGLANIDAKEKCTPQTNFRLASVTKQFTAMCILQLVEKGVLNITDPLSKYYPEFKNGEKITIYHLLTHSSGLLDYEDLISIKRKRPISDTEVLHLLATQTTFKFLPGTSYSYNNGGYCILKELIEKVSGMSYHDYLAKNIFSTLQMNQTVLSQRNKTKIRNRAYGYSIMNHKIVQTDNNLTSYTMGDGSIYSSVEDSAKWCIGKQNIITSTLLELSQQPHIETDEPNEYYGFGVVIKKLEGNVVICHEGDSIGFRSSIYFLPDRRIGVIFLSNSNKNSGNYFTEKIARYLLSNLGSLKKLKFIS